MKTPFNGKMAFFAAISLHTLIVMSEFVTFYTTNWMKPPKQTIIILFMFLNLPIWANFVDPIDLSGTTYHFRPANIILQPQPQPAKQVEDQAGQAARVQDC